jgi:NADPH:quinone reductase-like Zn-dependent oxidoreductase
MTIDQQLSMSKSRQPGHGFTAYQMLHRVAKIQAGQTIVVQGASGGVGTLLVQMARLAGVHVIGSASPAKHDIVKKMLAAGKVSGKLVWSSRP